jgi:hypothetical protein
MVVAEGIPVRACAKTPSAVLASATQLVKGGFVVPQQVPRAVTGFPPSPVRFAPSVASVVVILVCVGDERVGRVAAAVTVTVTLWRPLETPAFQHSRLYDVVTTGETGELLVPLKATHAPPHPPDAQHESAVPVTVHVSVDELPTGIEPGEAVNVRLGAEGASVTKLETGEYPLPTPLSA